MRQLQLAVLLLLGLSAQTRTQESESSYTQEFTKIVATLNQRRRDSGRREATMPAWELGLPGDKLRVGDLATLSPAGDIRHQIQGISNSHKVWGAVHFGNLTLDGLSLPGGKTKLIMRDAEVKFEFRLMRILGRCVFEWRSLVLSKLGQAELDPARKGVDLEDLRAVANDHMKTQVFKDHVTDKTNYCAFENQVYPECCGDMYSVNAAVDKALEDWNKGRGRERRLVRLAFTPTEAGELVLGDLSTLRRVGTVRRVIRDHPLPPLLAGRVALGNFTLYGATVLHEGVPVTGDLIVPRNSFYFEATYLLRPNGTCKFSLVQVQLKEAEDAILTRCGEPDLDVGKDVAFRYRPGLNLELSRLLENKAATADFFGACNPGSPFRPLISPFGS